MLLKKFDLLYENIKANIVYENSIEKNDIVHLINEDSKKEDDPYHYILNDKLYQIRNIKYESFINLMEKIKEEEESENYKITSSKKGYYKISKKSNPNKDGWDIWNYLKKQYKKLESYEPSIYGEYIILSWPESVPSDKKFILGTTKDLEKKDKDKDKK